MLGTGEIVLQIEDLPCTWGIWVQSAVSHMITKDPQEQFLSTEIGVTLVHAGCVPQNLSRNIQNTNIQNTRAKLMN